MGSSRKLLGTVAIVIGLGLFSAVAADAGIIWNSSNRFVMFGVELNPTPSGARSGLFIVSAPLVGDGNTFAPFSAALGGTYPAMGAWQTSAIGPFSIDVTGYASRLLTDFSDGNYNHLGVGESRCTIAFTVDEPTPFTLTVNPTSAPAYPVTLKAAGQPAASYLPTGGNTAVYTGTLAPGTWTFNASPGGLGAPYGVDAHLVLPEPASTVTLAVAVGALVTRRRRNFTL